MRGEAWDTAHDSRSEEDATDDLCDDSGLAQLGESKGEDATEDDDDDRLDDEEADWIGSIVVGWVDAGEDRVGGSACPRDEVRCYRHRLGVGVLQRRTMKQDRLQTKGKSVRERREGRSKKTGSLKYQRLISIQSPPHG